MSLRVALFATALLLGACSRGPRHAPATAWDAGGDGGLRIRTIAEVPPLGPTPDGNEVDVPLAWIHLIADPVPTGTAPSAAVGARLPCGFEPLFAASERGDREVRLRLRARRIPGRSGTCTDRPSTVQLVSLGVLRLGDWQVLDASAHAPTDDPAPSRVTQRVVADDTTLAPTLARWTRPCALERDCSAGGVCARIADVGVCVPPVDPWLGADRHCPGGTHTVDVSRATVTWRVCLGACEPQHPCPDEYSCTPSGVCLPAGDGGVGHGDR